MMRQRPSWQIALSIYVIYLVIAIGAMMAGGANYLNMTGPDVIFGSIVLPLMLGMIFLVVAVSWLGWWKPLMRESELASPRWLKWPVILIAAVFIAYLLGDTSWSNITPMHLLWLVAGAILVGFNEELLTRGILVLGFREGGKSEIWVLAMSSLFFGLLHLPNALIGLPIWGAATQVIFASIMGAGFYVVRRTAGLLIVPMVIHGLWDFATFSHGASGAEAQTLQGVLQFTSYGVAIICAVTLAIKTRGQPAHNAARNGAVQ